MLNEDKKYFQDSKEVYPGAEILVNEEDTQDISVPIIQHVKGNVFEHFEKRLPECSFNTEFLQAMMTK